MRTRSLSPAKSGSIHGKLKPSPLGFTMHTDTITGKLKPVRANRAERRRLDRTEMGRRQHG